MKKYLLTTSLFLFFAMVFGSVTFAKEEDMTEEQVDEKLRDLGVPEQRIDDMFIELKRNIAEQDNVVEYLGEEPVQEKIVQPFGAIDEGMMELYFDQFTTFVYDKDGNAFKAVRVYLHFDWNESPFWNLQDVVGFQWDADEFSPHIHSFESYIVYKNHSSGWDVHSSSVMSDITSSGVYDHIDLKTGWDTQQGYIVGNIIVENLPDDGKFEIYGKYVHNKISGNIGLTFLGFGSISVTGSSTYDEMATGANLIIE